jgi:3D (Asp-Asp-Asp) domain-containing protein
VVSTAYSYGCGGGWITASGASVGLGVIAMNTLDIGTTVRILSGPFAGSVETVLDHYGSGTQLDFWLPSCWEARQYGRQWIEIEVG